METDSMTCPQKSESQDECSSEEGKFADDRETAIQGMKNKDKEAINGLEKTKTPDSSFSPQPHDHPISSPADGAIEATMEDLSSADENDPNGDQEWPQVPGVEEDIQPEKNECQAIEIQDEVKENNDTSEDVQTSVHDTEGEEPITMTQEDKGSPQVPNVANEEGHELESHGDSDSKVFLSENSKEQNIDYKPVDFATNRDQWLRRDSRCDEPLNLTYFRRSSKCLLSKTEPSSSTQSESSTEPVVNSENIQQGELEENNPSSLKENEAVQQVRGADPPLETVAGKPTNPEQGNSACISTEVKEPLIMPQGRRNSKREEREGGETGEERKQTVCFTETGGTEGKQVEKVKDQRQERGNTGQRAESQSNTKPRLGEGKVNRMQVHFDDSQSDSGVSADFSPSTTDVLEGHDTDAPQLSESPPNETPIEREIRLTMKREQNLRRSRGLCDTTDKTNEFVEIPLRRPILSLDPQIRPDPSNGKDRQFAGKKMQKEISEETEREKVLVELGRLPGFYDKGTEVQLQEKKQLFESFQELKESVATINRSASNSTAESAAGIQDVDSAVDVKQLLMQFSQNPPTPPAMAQFGGTNGNPPAARGPGLSEGIKGQIIIIESNAIPITAGGPNGGSKADGGSVKVMNSEGVRASSAEPVRARQSPNLEVTEDEDLSLVKENPFFKLRSSISLQSQVELDIKEAKKREQELQRQRNSLYGGAAMYTDEGSGEGMDFRTEIRVKEERGTSIQEIPPPQWTDLTSADHQLETFTTTTSVRQSTGKLDLTWPPSQSDEDQRQLSETTVKIPRQKNPLLERWESGMVNDWD
ncbi:uncharacterized protein misp3 [Carassius gibelio]|uniref:uncharacterized protein misp3 n=1 Tax=Carassius gibelio TaxID=101364 RepID=UPI002277DEF0|nr:uncharacterized protein misp3 [Carassius gibelio]